MPWLSVCFGRRQKSTKRPSISPPLHLLLKPGQLQQHAFRAKPLRRPRPCHLCHQPVVRQASCCRVCNYICHQACEAKGEQRYGVRHSRYRDTSRFIHRQWQVKRSATFPIVDAVSALQENQPPTSVPSSPKSSLKSSNKKHQNGVHHGPERILKFAVPSSNGDIVTQIIDSHPSHDAIDRTVNSGPQKNTPSSISSPQRPTSQQAVHGGSVVAENGVARVTHSYKARQNSSTMSQASTAHRGSDEVCGSLRPSGDSAGMQLSYVTERLLALWCPGDSAAEARQGLLRATALLRNKHGDHYMVFNLSPRTVARTACEEIEEPSVRELGWARGLAPPLERLCALCKELDAWLCAGPHRLAVLAAQNMAGRERLGVAISAFMHYSLICGGEDQALDRYAMSRFLEERVGDFQQPSNKRYIGYFSGLLSGNIKINAQPLYLTHVTLIGAPAYEPVDPSPLAPESHNGGGCRLFLKVYQGLVPVHTSPVYHVAGSTRRLTVALERSLQLRGDVMLRCYHRHPPHQAAILSGEGRELIFSCQFHTCAVADYTLTFTRQELDHACLDLRFPLDGAVELTFSPSTTPRHPSPAPTPAVPVDYSPDPVTRWDSLDTLLSPAEFPPGAVSTSPHQQLRVGTSPVNQPLGVDTSEQHSPGYTPGPLDGSLYATVKKSPSGHSPTSAHQTPGPGGGGGVHSPHTVSMDSGISSAGNGQPQGGGGATDHHKMLDQLLNDMLLTVENIPDLPPTPKPAPTIDGIDDSLRALQEFQFSSSSGDTGHSSSSCFSQAAQPPPPVRRTSSPSSPPPRPHLPSTSSQQQHQAVSSTVSYHTSSSTTPPPRPQLPSEKLSTSTSSSPLNIEDQQNIPYHARQDSQPFTYGVTPPDISTMSTTMSSNRSNYSNGTINNTSSDGKTLNNIPPGLRSPSLVRKASTGKKSTSTTSPSNVVTSQKSPSFNYNNNNNNNNTWSPASSKNNKSWNSTSTISTSENHHYYNNSSSLLMTNGRRAKSPLEDDDTRDLLDGYTDSVGSSSSNGGLTWLQRQQQKLRDRKELQLRAERHPHETRLLTELRSVQNRILKPGASSTPRRPSTEDGYASDTTLLLSGLEDELGIVSDSPSPQFSTTPLVIGHAGGVAPPASHNYHKSGAGLSAPSSPLLPNRSSSRERTLRYGTGGSHSHHQELATIMSGVKPLSRQKSDTSFDRERPFVAIKRAHEQSRGRLDSQTSPPTSPLSMLAANPLGQLQSYYTQSSENRSQHHEGANNHGLNNGHNTPETNHYQPCKPVEQQINNIPEHSEHSPNSYTHENHYQKPNNINNLDSTFSPTNKQKSVTIEYQHYQQPSSLNHSYTTQPQKAEIQQYSPVQQQYSPVQQQYSPAQQYSPQQYKPAASPQYLHSPTSQDEFDGASRPQTPAFPVHPRTPYSNNGCVTPQPGDGPSSGLPPKSPTAQRRERSMSPSADGAGSVYGGQSRRSSVHSSSGDTVTQEVSPANVKFVRDTSRYWYKPNISREEAIALLRDQAPGTFVVRDSNSFPGAFGLALKVAVPPATPPGGTLSRPGEQGCELVRHFLIEPTSRGVKLKGCANEPVFSSLSALVYQHSITAIALPCRLLLPEKDIGGQSEGHRTLSLTQQLLSQGAACNVLYLITVDTESLTGPQAVRRAISNLFASRPLPKATVVHFKVSSQGITLTDNKRTLFFRRHYPVNTISFCGLDPDDHRWSQRSEDTGMPISSNRCFGFVARKPASQLSDNQCHIFAELEPEQPSTAIVNFVSKVMMSGSQSPSLGKANIV